MDFRLPFYIFFLEIQSKKTKKSGFWVSAWIFVEICVIIRIFVQKTWKSMTIFYPKKAGNPTSSMGGGQHFSRLAHFKAFPSFFALFLFLFVSLMIWGSRESLAPGTIPTGPVENPALVVPPHTWPTTTPSLNIGLLIVLMGSVSCGWWLTMFVGGGLVPPHRGLTVTPSPRPTFIVLRDSTCQLPILMLSFASLVVNRPDDKLSQFKLGVATQDSSLFARQIRPTMRPTLGDSLHVSHNAFL